MLLPLLLGAGVLLLVASRGKKGDAPSPAPSPDSSDVGVLCVDPSADGGPMTYRRALITTGFLARESGGVSNFNGRCDTRLVRATKEFQASKGLPVTGTIDKATSDAMEPFPRVFSMVRPSDWDVYGLGSAFIHIGPDLPKGSYRTAFTAAPDKGGLGDYKVESIISNPGDMPIKPGDSVVLFVYDAATDSWVYAPA